MRFGAMNFPIRPVLDEISEFSAYGFDYLELSLDPPEAHHTKVRAQKAEILARLDECAMALVFHLPTFVLMADLTESIRNASVEEMRRSMDLAAEMGAEKAVLHPAPITGLGPLVMELATGYAKDSLDRLLNHARSLDLRICLENMFPRYRSFYEPEHFVQVLADYPGLELTLDTGHANIEGGGRRIQNFVRRCGKRIGHVHASDNKGKRDDHLPVGEGTIDFAAVVRSLTDIGYTDTVTLEVFSEDRGRLAASRDRLRRLAQKHDGKGLR